MPTSTARSSPNNALPPISEMMRKVRSDLHTKSETNPEEVSRSSIPCSPTYSPTDSTGPTPDLYIPTSIALSQIPLTIEIHPHSSQQQQQRSGGGGGGGVYDIERPHSAGYGCLPSPVSQTSTRCPSFTEAMMAENNSPRATPASVHGDPNSMGYSNLPGRGMRLAMNSGAGPAHYRQPVHPDYSIHSRRGTLSSLPYTLDGVPPGSTGGGHGPSGVDSMILATNTKLSEEEDARLKSEKRRKNHLNSEKRRRENIKGGMDALVELVPSCRNIQESKANILRKTKDYILQLVYAHRESQIELKRLREENAELRRMFQPLGTGHTDLSAYRGGHGIGPCI